MSHIDAATVVTSERETGARENTTAIVQWMKRHSFRLAHIPHRVDDEIVINIIHEIEDGKYMEEEV